MKHFVVEITYRVPAEELGEATAQHREYLQAGYQAGTLLFSGPQVPRTGGIVVARAETAEEIESFFGRDPYRVRGLADYRFVEFNPVFAQAFMKSWVSGS
jgi:uncharacterized protein YciI